MTRRAAFTLALALTIGSISGATGISDATNFDFLTFNRS